MKLQTGTVPPKKVTAVSHFLSHSPAPYYTVSLTLLTLQHNPPPLQAHTEAVPILDNVFNVGPCTNEVYKIVGIFDPLFPVCMKLHSIQNNLLTMSDFGVPLPLSPDVASFVHGPFAYSGELELCWSQK